MTTRRRWRMFRVERNGWSAKRSGRMLVGRLRRSLTRSARLKVVRTRAVCLSRVACNQCQGRMVRDPSALVPALRCEDCGRLVPLAALKFSEGGDGAADRHKD